MKRLPAILVAAVLGLVALAVPAAAQPAAGRTYVAFGDSYTSGPDYDPSGRCNRLPGRWTERFVDRWPGAAANWADHSCSGAAILSNGNDSLGMQVSAAGADLGPATRLVTVQIGGNEHLGTSLMGTAWSTVSCLVDLVTGCELHDRLGSAQPIVAEPASINAAAFADALDASHAIADIRARAPHAMIALVGYPTVLPDGPFCLPVAGIDTVSIQWHADYARSLLDALEAAQAGAAAKLGLAFWSLRAATRGHDVCQPAGTRWITRVGDFGDELLPFHPSRVGHDQLGAILTQARVAARIG